MTGSHAGLFCYDKADEVNKMVKYYEDNYCRELDTVITEVLHEEDRTYIRLADTIFYAQGGGQKSDRGMIVIGDTEYHMLKSIKDENGDPVHLTDIPDPQPGQQVHLILDWDFRYLQMKLHTCLHIMHLLIKEQIGHEIENPLVADIEETFAYNKYPNAVVSDVDMEQVEQNMNELFSQDVEVTTFENVNDSHYRYWKCRDDIIPCGGIHVYRLSEIGKIKLSSHAKKGKMTVKVELA